MEGFIWLAVVASVIIALVLCFGIWLGKKIGKSIAKRNDAKLKAALERDLERMGRPVITVSSSRQSMAQSHVNRAYPHKLSSKDGSKGVETRILRDKDVEFDEDDFDGDMDDLLEMNRDSEVDRDYVNKWTAGNERRDNEGSSDLAVAIGAGMAIGAGAAIALSEDDDDPVETVEECTRSFAESEPEPESPVYESAPEPSYDSGSSFDSGDGE